MAEPRSCENSAHPEGAGEEHLLSAPACVLNGSARREIGLVVSARHESEESEHRPSGGQPGFVLQFPEALDRRFELDAGILGGKAVRVEGCLELGSADPGEPLHRLIARG